MPSKFRAASGAVVFDGQSLNNYPAVPDNMPTLVLADLPGVPGLNISRDTTSWTDLVGSVAWRRNPKAHIGLTTILLMNGGTSDILGGDTGATLYADEVSYANSARTAGYDLIVAVTLCPNVNNTGGMETARVDHNTLLLADASNAFDAVVDIANLPELDDPADLTYYLPSNPHWTAAGAAAAAGAIVPVVAGLL